MILLRTWYMRLCTCQLLNLWWRLYRILKWPYTLNVRLTTSPLQAKYSLSNTPSPPFCIRYWLSLSTLLRRPENFQWESWLVYLNVYEPREDFRTWGKYGSVTKTKCRTSNTYTYKLKHGFAVFKLPWPDCNSHFNHLPINIWYIYQ